MSAHILIADPDRFLLASLQQASARARRDRLHGDDRTGVCGSGCATLSRMCWFWTQLFRGEAAMESWPWSMRSRRSDQRS